MNTTTERDEARDIVDDPAYCDDDRKRARMLLLERRPLDTLNVNDLAVLRRIIGEVLDGELPPPSRVRIIEAVIDRVIAEAVPAVKEMP